MKIRILATLLILASCGGRLSDEQRKKMIENMELNKVKKFTDAEITDAAYQFGRSIAKTLETRDKTLTNNQLIDSLQRTFHVQILPMSGGDTLLHQIEQQIIEAYTSGDGNKLSDNVQKIGKDSLLYTLPIMKERPDGTVEFVKAIGIRISKKEVILSIKE